MKVPSLQQGFKSMLATLLVTTMMSPLFAGHTHEDGRVCTRTLEAHVVALDHAFFNNRMGAMNIGGMIFALKGDVVSTDGSANLTAGNVTLREGKRPRPIVLRMNEGDCLKVHFTNLLAEEPMVTEVPSVVSGGSTYMTPPDAPQSPDQGMKDDPNSANGQTPTNEAQSATRYAGVHVMGMELIDSINSDGSWVGRNPAGTIAPGKKATYTFHAAEQGAFMLYSDAATVGYSQGFGGQLSQGLFGSVQVQPRSAEYYRGQVDRDDMKNATWSTQAVAADPNRSLAPKTNQQNHQEKGPHGQPLWLMTSKNGVLTNTVPVVIVADYDSYWDQAPGIGADGNGQPAANGFLRTPDWHPVLNYQAMGADGKPILNMVKTHEDGTQELVHTDLFAVITGPGAGNFPIEEDGPTFAENPAYPNTRQPYREFAIHYHDDFTTAQSFEQFISGNLAFTLSTGRDFFAINYGMGAIGPPVLANRLNVGPALDCVTCAYEEFFLSSWPLGDPAMIVDNPANSVADGKVVTGERKATKAFYPDDPSNVYHSYIGDHTRFRIMHAGTNITHIHHQHAHQWLHTPTSDDSNYRDSQMITPGACYTLDFVYHGSGNKNQVVGDSIFHCHFYPHFAQGMWSLWRTHDVFEEGTRLQESGTPVDDWNRSLPDPEIAQGTPVPAIVPLPTIAMAPIPGRVKLEPVSNPANLPVNVKLKGDDGKIAGFKVVMNDADKQAGLNPGYPFYIPGIAGQRAAHPPLDFAPEEDEDGKQVVKNGEKQYLDGGLPRHIVFAGNWSQDGTVNDVEYYEQHNRWDFTKSFKTTAAFLLPEEGTELEKLAMKAHATRSHPSYTPEGVPGNFTLNGLPPAHGAPYAEPGMTLSGQPVNEVRRYKGVNVQIDAVFNKKGWHYPQQRIITLWGDAKDQIDNKRRPEPFFFRANSGEVVEYWHSNLVPEYYELDDFQVRTPTDVIGQHIHLVKFDVTSSDGAADGFNYEDGTLSPEFVRTSIESINRGGLFAYPDPTQRITRTLEPKAIPYFQKVFVDEVPPAEKEKGKELVLGSQATIQRWYADPLYNNEGEDRTIRTVFTHDHFSPSTHQQSGLYAALVVEPAGSSWFDNVTGAQMGDRFDGGPTSWQAVIETADKKGSYREFMMEFQDRTLTYYNTSKSTLDEYSRYTMGTIPQSKAPMGWANPGFALSPPTNGNPGNQQAPYPKLVTGQFATAGYSVNYQNEPMPFRLTSGAANSNAFPDRIDLSQVYRSIVRNDPAMNVQPQAGTKIYPADTNPDAFTFPPAQPGVGDLDPYTSMLRAYEGDRIQVRPIVGAHMEGHFFNMHGHNWLFEPAWHESGYRETQGMSISEYYILDFRMPPTDKKQKTADYLWSTSSGVTGLEHGNWGIMRSYKDKQDNLPALPNNKNMGKHLQIKFPKDVPVRSYHVTATTILQATGKPLVYNDRGRPGTPGVNQLAVTDALIYVRNEDLDANGRLLPGLSVEPLILRAAAGDRIEVSLTNKLPANQSLGSAQSLTPVNIATITGSKQEIDQMVFAMEGPGQTTPPGKDIYTVEFAKRFNTNEFGFVLPENANEAQSVGPDTPIDGWKIVGPDGQSYSVTRANANPDTQLLVSTTIPLYTSQNVGLHAGLVLADITHSDGINVGNNPIQTAAPGQTVNYSWYAGRFMDNGHAVPVEFGAVNLTPSDPLLQHPYGLLGAMVIEPRGATWKVDEHTRSAAVVTTENKWGHSESFREFVLVLQDDVTSMGYYTPKDGPQTTTPTDLPAPALNYAFNYRTEHLGYRYKDPNFLLNTDDLAPTGIARALSNTLVANDPRTPVLSAGSGSKVRIRICHPAGLNDQNFNLYGHQWQEVPYTHGSRKIGDNPRSNALGTRTSFGPYASFDIVLDSAGGPAEITGDYLYRTWVGTDFLGGLWGVMRVGNPDQDIVTVNVYTADQIYGSVTANTATGKMTDKVAVYKGKSKLAEVDVIPNGTLGFFYYKGKNLSGAITVKSVEGGGSEEVPGYITPIKQNDVDAKPSYPPSKEIRDGEHLRWKARTISGHK